MYEFYNHLKRNLYNNLSLVMGLIILVQVFFNDGPPISGG